MSYFDSNLRPLYTYRYGVKNFETKLRFAADRGRPQCPRIHDYQSENVYQAPCFITSVTIVIKKIFFLRKSMIPVIMLNRHLYR